MAISKAGANKTLFNDSLFSDVTIRQTCNGVAKEYNGHKAILCTGSTWFMKAFTGVFQEATSSVINMSDDDPEYFEVMLRYLYTHKWDTSSISSLQSRSTVGKSMISIGVYALADKYDVEALRACAAENIPDYGAIDTADAKKIVEAHYGQCAGKDCLVGPRICSYLRSHASPSPSFLRSPDCKALIRKHAHFSQDLALLCLDIKGRLW